jgi:hypothetical protein
MAMKGRAMRRRYDSNIDIDGLDCLSRVELRKLWAQELGEQPPASLGRDILARYCIRTPGAGSDWADAAGRQGAGPAVRPHAP